MTARRLHRLHDEFGQSPWIDNLQRRSLTDGSLERLRDRGVRGLTSNPTIFHKAITGSDDYDEQFAQLIGAGLSTADAYWTMVVDDIRGACEVFAPVHESSDGGDGFVSVEVDPELAYDGTATLTAARDLHELIDRPNVMIKIPGTPVAPPAIRQMIAEGRSVNVTLIFSLERYRTVAETYVAGLEELARDPTADLASVASVASFFVSRVDTAVDALLDALGGDRARAQRGRAAIAQAHLAYRIYGEIFTSERFAALAARGARPQRLLWASTGTKDPGYSDVLYVDNLIGPNTVNTLPDPTLEAFDDHGRLHRTLDADPAQDDLVWSELSAIGIDMATVAQQLESEGVESFRASFAALLDDLGDKRTQLEH